jgi:phage N-6-adenine-methyltransferase
MSESLNPFVSSITDEWSTPPEFVRPLADAVGGFDLDPASGAEQSPIANQTYTETDDGLSQSWFGSVWCNPPYSEMQDWTQKAIKESQRDDTDLILYLCKGDSSTDWWQEAAKAGTVIAAIDERLKFGNGENSAPFASHVIGFGNIPTSALDVLASRGLVLDATAIYQRTEQEKIVTENI